MNNSDWPGWIRAEVDAQSKGEVSFWSFPIHTHPSSTRTNKIIRYNPLMPRLLGLGNIVTELRAERAHLVNNLRHVDAALAVLGKLEGGKFATASRRSLSAAARRRIATAQKARWAKVRSQSQSASGKSGGTRTKRTLSAAARRKIAAAQRARWAKVRATQEKSK